MPRSYRRCLFPNKSPLDGYERHLRFDIVSRMRAMTKDRLYAMRPPWLTWAERAPPLKMHNLLTQSKTIHNPYPDKIKRILRDHPTLRFADCFVDGNEWIRGVDQYRYDHPAVQIAARWLNYEHRGLDREEAYRRAVDDMYQRRLALERNQRVAMALLIPQTVND